MNLFLICFFAALAVVGIVLCALAAAAVHASRSRSNMSPTQKTQNPYRKFYD